MDLPEPDGPMMRHELALGDGEGDAAQRLHGAVAKREALDEVVRFEDHRHRP